MAKLEIPNEIKEVAEKLQEAGFKAYLVGGSVRDILLARQNFSEGNLDGRDPEPKDWDISTDAKPEEIQKIFPESVYENQFGTVGVKVDSDDKKLKIVEITTFRLEGKYTDKRHPDEIRFAKTIEEDLSRRDFTINSIALKLPITNYQLLEVIDPFDGGKDLKNKIIRTVGNPRERFNEDALRLMRAVRFAVELSSYAGSREVRDFSASMSGPALGWEIEKETREAVKNEAGLLEMITKERIRDEFEKIIMSRQATKGIILLEELGLLRYVMPELREGINCGQNKHHIYTVFEHNVRALNYAVEKDYSLVVRIASLLHDVGKPRTKQGDGPDSTFYNHEVVGAKMAFQILDRLRFSKEIVEKAVHLVRCHLFYYNVGEVTAAGVRRFLQRVGPENVPDLLKVREADRIGSGVPKAFPYKLRHLLFMIDKVKHDPVSPKMLKINGTEIMKILGISPSPRVGRILGIILDEVLDEPKNNEPASLKKRVQELGKFSDEELQGLAEKAKLKKDEFESGVEEEMKRKYYVK